MWPLERSRFAAEPRSLRRLRLILLRARRARRLILTVCTGIRSFGGLVQVANRRDPRATRSAPTSDGAARHYADIPSLRPLHEAAVADAFEEVVAAARAPTLLSPEQEADWRAAPEHAGGIVEPDAVAPLLDGDQDVWLASCAGFYASPHGEPGAPCPQPFWGCLDCGNAVITNRKLPGILAFLAFIEAEREGVTAPDWHAK